VHCEDIDGDWRTRQNSTDARVKPLQLLFGKLY
jgi:hypothetical protein